MAQDQKVGRGLDATGEAVRSNIRRIRDEVLRIPVTELSRRLDKLERPIPPLGLRRIEDGTRRVDADDLVAIAVALDVSPVTLLMPSIDSVTEDDPVEVTGLPSAAAKASWLWLTAQTPAGGTEDWGEHLAFVRRACPSWEYDASLERHAEWAERMLDQGASGT